MVGTLADNPIPFTSTHVKNKQLVIQMLNYEENLTKSDFGQNLYKNILNSPLISLTIEHAINRLVLAKFGFDTSDLSVSTYRTIFQTYYNSSSDYDPDVLNAVHYMRENKCVYYKQRPLEIGDVIPDCELYEIDGITKTTLYNIINKESKYTMIGAFSLS
jgi:hypothetical protein